ncbi:hypothetical protein I8748_03440 [Nostoc sp. CENA67]|uniref:Uncharacterized protein n=1 Tax=Amazonocrinis nigriterrae CENA67 TaxID=2794033 RepID=A0A8J7HKH8_9NOST|nr:hypothetical protein [Amazonocrinis nigriterrae]MBH8561238.1 hypothetical protein [Amazonocrinis nigriterrae CENA67]
MTRSVADKTPISDHFWRRHTDPPGLWIAVAISSISLHLLAFWLIRSSHVIRLGFSQQEQADIPIELVEISPQAKSRASVKPVVANRLSKNQNSQAAKLPKQVTKTDQLAVTPPAADISNQGAIASASEKRAIASASEKRANIQQRQLQEAEQQRRLQEAEQQRQLQEAEQQRQLQEAEQQRQLQEAEQQRRLQEAEQQRQLQEAEQQRQREQAQQDKPVGTGEQLPPPPEPQTQTGIFASWVPVSEDEQRKLMREPLPKNLKLAEHIGSNEKQVASLYINSNLELPAVEFLVSLIIDNTGKFIEAKVIDQAIPQASKSKYEEFANDVFQGEKFQPARYPDGTTPPEWSNLFVRIKIERR